jgi:hypothetical protein
MVFQIRSSSSWISFSERIDFSFSKTISEIDFSSAVANRSKSSALLTINGKAHFMACFFLALTRSSTTTKPPPIE